jgi:uncharacterized membrane protein YfcA
MELDLATLALLVAAAFVAGFVDSIAGGGGLITLPALLLAGISPVEAVATNKLQSTFGAATATWRFWRAGHLDLPALRPALLTSLCGAALGAVMLDAIDASILSRAMPVLLIAIALYFALAPSAENLPREARLTPSAFAIGLAAPIGFYDGIFGPGTGSFFTAALVVFAGLGLLKATAHTKALNLASNIASLAVFMLSGHLLYAVGLPMAVGQMAGARLGAGAAITHGARLIRPLIVLVTIAIAIRLLMR